MTPEEKKRIMMEAIVAFINHSFNRTDTSVRIERSQLEETCKISQVYYWLCKHTSGMDSDDLGKYLSKLIWEGKLISDSKFEPTYVIPLSELANTEVPS